MLNYEDEGDDYDRAWCVQVMGILVPLVLALQIVIRYIRIVNNQEIEVLVTRVAVRVIVALGIRV